MMMADMPFWDFDDKEKGEKKKVGTYINSEGAVCDEFDMEDFNNTFTI